MKGQLHISMMWAYIVMDDDNTEGVVGMKTPSGWIPLVGADELMMKNLRPEAEFIARKIGKPVQLIRFTTREEIEVIEP